MEVSLTDLELCSILSEDIYESYLTAIDFNHTYPDYSLLQYRNIAELIVNLIAGKSHVEFSSQRLVDRIQDLFDCQLISHPFQSNLHEIRRLGNFGAHKATGLDQAAQGVQSDEDRDANQEFLKKRKAWLAEQAQVAQRATITALQDTFRVLHPNENLSQIILTEVNDQRHKEALYEGIVSLDAAKKFRSGLICEGLLDEIFLTMGFLLPSSIHAQTMSLKEQAASLYEAAARISAEIDKHIIEEDYRDDETIIHKFAKVEELYQFANVVLTHDGLEHRQEKALKWVKAAADRNYAPAAALYGNNLLDSQSKDAIRYLMQGADADEVLALRSLFFYYTDGELSEPEPDKALEYLNRACELGCPDAIANLGVAYHEGEFIVRDDQKARQLLDEAISKGSAYAQKYKVVVFDDLAGKTAAMFQNLADQLAKNIEASKPKHIVVGKRPGRNERCPCGSGKKYKKCCG